MARGDDLAVDLQQRLDARLEARVGAQHVGVALRLVAEAEVLAHRDVRGPERLDEHVVEELLRAALGELAVERDDDQLLDAEPGDELGLALERRQQPRRRPGATTDGGCGSKVRTVSAPRMTSRWPRWTPSNVPTATRRGRGSTSGSRVTFMRAEAYGRLEQRRPRAARRWRSGRRRRAAATGPSAARRGGDRHAVAARRASSPASRDDRQDRAQHVAERASRSGSASATANGPIAVRRSSSQYASPRSATSERTYVPAEHSIVEPAARSPRATAPRSAYTVTSRSASSTSSPAPRQAVGALAADLHRAVGRRALAQLAGRQHERLGDRRAGLDDLALGVAGRRHRAEAARPSRRSSAAP